MKKGGRRGELIGNIRSVNYADSELFVESEVLVESEETDDSDAAAGLFFLLYRRRLRFFLTGAGSDDSAGCSSGES